MSLSPRAIALQGIGSTPRLVAVQGLWPDQRVIASSGAGRRRRLSVPVDIRSIDAEDDVLLIMLALAARGGLGYA